MDENNSTIIIIILVIFIIIAILGISIGNFVNIISSYFFGVLQLLGFSTGSAINATAEIVGETSKAGIDIAEDSVKNFGNLLKNAPPPPPNVKPVKENLDNGNFNSNPSPCPENIFKTGIQGLSL
jgi:hypothetical protein